tara:strand:+ start:469 stop:1092 length:624 start_codon:yes stop_codon:yes gene_type:complete
MKVMTLKKNGHIVVEEIPTNSASSGAVAGLPPDEPPVRKKKRKNKMGIDIFQRIRNSKLKEQTMEDQNTVTEQDQSSANSEVGATMRFIQQKRKMQKRQEREKRASNRKGEIQQLSKAKAKDYQKKAGDRQKKIAKDINKKDTKNESFDWQSSFSQVNARFDELKQEEQEKMLFTWMELSETNQETLLSVLSQDDGIEKIKKFIETV